MSKKNYYRDPYNVLKEDVNNTEYVEDDRPSPKTVEIPVKAERIVKGKICDCIKVNVRKDPSITSEVEVIIPVNAEVDVIKSFKNDEWYKVVTATKVEGYIMKDYVAIKE